MTLFGIKSIAIMLVIEILVCLLFKQLLGLSQLIGSFVVINVIFWGVISVYNGKVKVYSMQSLFKRATIELNEIDKVTIRDGGMTQAFSAITFDLKNKSKRTVYILLYSFERKKVRMFFYKSGIEVYSFDASSNN